MEAIFTVHRFYVYCGNNFNNQKGKSIQVNNNVQSPNFGMALKIGKGGREFLAKQSEEVLTKLGKIGEDMKDYKHWDLFVTEDGYEAAQKTRGVIPHYYVTSVNINPNASTNKIFKDRIQFDTYIGRYANKGSKAEITFENLEPSEVEKVKNNFSMYSTPEKFAEFIRFLERRSLQDDAVKAAEEAKKARINGLVDDLVSKFSVDA